MSDCKHDNAHMIEGGFIQNTDLQSTPGRNRFFSVDESENADAAKKAPLFIPKVTFSRPDAKMLDRTLSEKTVGTNDQIDQNVSFQNMSVEAYLRMGSKSNFIFGDQLKRGTENIPEFYPPLT